MLLGYLAKPEAATIAGCLRRMTCSDEAVGPEPGRAFFERFPRERHLPPS